MHAGIITGQGQLEFQEFPEPDPTGETGIVVEIRYCGICGTDVHAYQHGGPYPAALCGHEWGGAVSKVASGVSRVREGDRVCVAILPPCGNCVECRAGHPLWCLPAMASLGGGDPCGSAHGGYASSIAVSEGRVALVPDRLSDEEAAQVEPATVAYHGVRRSAIRLVEPASGSDDPYSRHLARGDHGLVHAGGLTSGGDLPTGAALEGEWLEDAERFGLYGWSGGSGSLQFRTA